MTSNEKIKDIKTRFGLDDAHMSMILHTSQNRIRKIIRNEIEPTSSELGYLSRALGIEIDILTDPTKTIPLGTMKISIDMTKYKNIFNAYVETLKEYYNEPWEVYVLAKIKVKTNFQKFCEILSISPKKEIDKEMSTFTPNYLAVKKDVRLLISITNGTLEVTEVPLISKEPRFVYNNYRYVRANKIFLERYVSGVERYF